LSNYLHFKFYEHAKLKDVIEVIKLFSQEEGYKVVINAFKSVVKKYLSSGVDNKFLIRAG
jgi:hypothetical protein